MNKKFIILTDTVGARTAIDVDCIICVCEGVNGVGTTVHYLGQYAQTMFCKEGFDYVMKALNDALN